MGVDLYAGPLCRFYARDYDTAVDRAMGKRSIILTPNGEMPRRRAIEFREAMLGWRKSVLHLLRAGGADGVIWDESHNGEYLTDQIQYEGWLSLLLWAAYDEAQDFTPPDALPPKFDRDAAWASLASQLPATAYPNLQRCKVWLPVRLREPVSLPLAHGTNALAGSLEGLLRELDRLADALPDRGWVNGGAREARQPTALRAAVTNWLEVWRRHARFALQRPVPMLIDD